MFLSWWMIGVMGLVWAVSLVVHGNISFRTGGEAVIIGLKNAGYIEFDKNGDIVGPLYSIEESDSDDDDDDRVQ